MTRRIKFVVSVLAALTFATSVAADSSRPAANPLYDIVAVGRGRRQVVLASVARPLTAYRWRYRSLPMRPEGARARAVLLSRSSTKALVVFSDGVERVFDLTEELSGIGEDTAHKSQHRLPGQYFPVARAGRVCLTDDAGQTEVGACRVAERAAVHEDGRVLYAMQDGSLFVAHPVTGQDELLPFRLPPVARYEILGGQQGDRRDFLLLVERGGAVHLIDPTRARELHADASWEVAALRAMVEFGSDEPQSTQRSVSDQVLRTLAANLVEQVPPDTYEWSFFRAKPEVALYAPVLEFANGEPAFPSDVGIWDILNRITRGTTREAYQQAYDTLGEERYRRCKVYFRQTSYPGSWVLEYWYYYPFDEGKPHPHIHDSEHIFIEVDKLGGTVRSFLAADHGQFAPNNSYSTFLPGAQPVELPLFALVEFGKHAMCPDINRDGAFTRGVDVNLYREKYAVWGLRDLGGDKEHLMEPYRPSMSLPRRKEDRFGLENYSSYFPNLEVSAEKATCDLLAFPDDPPCKDCGVGTVGAAVVHLTAHPDARKPENIYKPWVLPWHQVRVGLGLFYHAGNHTQLYGAYVSDLWNLTRGLLPLPGRLSLEFMWSLSSHETSYISNGRAVSARLSSETYFGARYERLVTNTQGFYFGVAPQIRRFATIAVDSRPVQPDPRWQYNGIWFMAGYLFELPSRKKGNMTHHVGIVFQGRTIRCEWRVSLGLLRRRGRDTFGISAADPNPYQ